MKLDVRDLSVTGNKLFLISCSTLAQVLTPPTCIPKSPVRMLQPNRTSWKFSCSFPVNINMTVLYLELGCDRVLTSPSQFVLTNDVLQASHLTLCLYEQQKNHGRVSLRNWHSGSFCVLWNRQVHHRLHTSPLLSCHEPDQSSSSSPVLLL
jgi:hypothetical protein